MKKPNPAEAFVYKYYFQLLSLLQIGIPYSEIMRMNEEEINYLIGINSALNEVRAESAS